MRKKQTQTIFGKHILKLVRNNTPNPKWYAQLINIFVNKMRPSHNASVYLHVQPVDFRKSVNLPPAEPEAYWGTP